MDLALPRLRAHATAVLLCASAALAAACATSTNSSHLLLALFACAVAASVAAVTWRYGERFGELTLTGLVALVTALIALSAALTHTSAAGEVMLFLLPALFSACLLPAGLALAAVIACSIADGWLVAGQGGGGVGGVIRWITATVVLGSAAGTAAVFRGRLTAVLHDLAGQARHDSLTGLLNRRGFDERVAHELERQRRAGEPFAILMCDLDSFKQINDVHGHAVGDLVLTRVGQVLVEGVRPFDAVARIGGEEIAVLLVGCDEQTACGVAERLRAAVAAPVEGQPSVTVSIGVAASGNVPNAGVLFQRADGALYAAKRAGRNRVFRAHADGPALVLVA
jgi:diguanylate cyclase (GGDEF)-like protein